MLQLDVGSDRGRRRAGRRRSSTAESSDQLPNSAHASSRTDYQSFSSADATGLPSIYGLEQTERSDMGPYVCIPIDCDEHWKRSDAHINRMNVKHHIEDDECRAVLGVPRPNRPRPNQLLMKSRFAYTIHTRAIGLPLRRPMCQDIPTHRRVPLSQSFLYLRRDPSGHRFPSCQFMYRENRHVRGLLIFPSQMQRMSCSDPENI
jgi:hypothetical protein